MSNKILEDFPKSKSKSSLIFGSSKICISIYISWSESALHEIKGVNWGGNGVPRVGICVWGDLVFFFSSAWCVASVGS